MWVLLRGPGDYESYVSSIATQHGLIGAEVNWGHGPQEYPALVSSYVPPIGSGPTRVLSAYVYRADVACLFPFATAADGPAAPHPEVVGARPPDQRKFNRWVATELLTIVHFMVETGICKTERFESKLVEFLDRVRDWHGQDRNKLSQQLGRAEMAVLESLGPDT